MITYFFALFVYFNYYDDFIGETEDDKPCLYLVNCFAYILDKTFKV